MNTPLYLINSNRSIKDAMAQLNAMEYYLTLFVVNAVDKLIGTLTDGDIRRGLLKGLELNDSIEKFMNPTFKCFKENENNLDLLVLYKKMDLKIVPVLNDKGSVVKLYNLNEKRSFIPVDTVIMAGGRGERLRPLTDTIPKPLLKVGEKPIIEHNIDRLINYGVENIYVSVNYLSEQITSYLGSGAEKNSNIHFINEEEPLGTIGAAGKVDNFNKNVILLMNSDLLTNIDFEDFYRCFERSEADMAVATIPYKVDVPYAIMEIDGVDKVKSFIEKPSYTYYSNAGIYLIKKELLGLIPKNTKYDATDLMDQVIKSNRKLISYPILGYWLDIGGLQEYKKAQEDIKHITL